MSNFDPQGVVSSITTSGAVSNDGWAGCNIVLSKKVKECVRDVVPSRTLGPILKALELASAEERAQNLAGIRTLRRLSQAVVSEGGEDQNAKTAVSGQEMEDHR